MKTVINDLFDYKDLKIVQYKEGFRFSLDSILLAEFIKITPSVKKIIDLCTGNAPIPLILSTKTKATIKGVEIQEKIYNCANESVKINHKESQIEIIRDDCNNLKTLFDSESFDIVSCNPPYFKVNEGSFLNDTEEKRIARHEIKIDLEKIIKMAEYLLKNNGKFYLSHRVERFEEIYLVLKKYNFVVKRIQYIYSKPNDDAKLILIEATKNGKQGMVVNKPVLISEVKTYQNLFEE